MSSTTVTVNALCIDVDDLEGAFIESGRSIRSLHYGVAAETEALLATLAVRGTKATFFGPGHFVKLAPDLIGRIQAEGHQIASHGLRHDYVWKYSRGEFIEDVSAIRKTLEDLTGQAVDTYKAPIWSITPQCAWAYDALLEAGYRVDHSAFPALKRHLGLDPARMEPFLHSGGLWVVPMTVVKLAGMTLPFGGGVYNAWVPVSVQLRLLGRINAAGLPFNFYFHPFEHSPGRAARGSIERGSLFVRAYALHHGRYARIFEHLEQRFRFAPLCVAYARWIGPSAA
jgi:polysaccharide deacetylase family protein (PEP-CTERM system associated)